MHITIECLSGSLAGKVFTFDQPEIGLGRGENQKKDIDFADTDIGVSRNHALIVLREQRVYLVDQSRGGTLVRGQRIQGTTFEVRSGEEVQLGGPSGPRLRVRFRAMTQIEPPRGETGIFEPPAPLPPTVQSAPVQPLPPAVQPVPPAAQPLPPAALLPSEPVVLQPLVAPLTSPPVGAPLQPGPANAPMPLELAPVPTPPPRPRPAPVQNSETMIQLQPESAPPNRPVINQETMLQSPAPPVSAPEPVVPPINPPAPPLKPVSPQSSTVVQLPPTPPRPGAREANASSGSWPNEPFQAASAPAYSSEATPPPYHPETYVQQPTADEPYRQPQPGNRSYQSPSPVRAEDATYFQGAQEADYPVPRPNANRPLPNGLPNGGQTILQAPAPTNDTDPTVLQEDNNFPWLPFSLIGLAALVLLGVIWVFLLRQPIYFFLPLPIVLVLGLGAFFFWRRQA